jgi:hypothetical protein
MKTKNNRQNANLNDIVNLLLDILQNEVNQLPETLKSLSPEQRIDIIMQILSFLKQDNASKVLDEIERLVNAAINDYQSEKECSICGKANWSGNKKCIHCGCEL